MLVLALVSPDIQVTGIAIPLTTATSSHSGAYGGAYGSLSSYGSSPYKLTKSYNPYSSAMTSSPMHSSMSYTSPYSSPYSSAYTNPYSYGSMGSMSSMSPMNYYDQMPAYETAIDVHGAGFY